MDILAASYTNIGPFFDRTLSVIFKKGKYVINAPVGTGKSFLFFDGPIFSLYKHASRPIRNRRSTTGNTQLIFSIDDDIWLVIRKLWWTKLGWDSVKTKLYKCKYTANEISAFFDTYTMFWDKNRKNLLWKHIEEIVCANEKEVESLLQDLLPPKEVVLSANFLMQDAVNIFELAPAQRLDIFKHMFGFIWIDHAKDTLRDKRKEVQTRITVMWDMSDLQRQCDVLIGALRSNTKYMREIAQTYPHLTWKIEQFINQWFFNDLVLLDGSIWLEGFVCDVDMEPWTVLLAYIQQLQSNYRTLQWKISQQKEYVLWLESEKKDLVTSITWIDTQLQVIKKQWAVQSDNQLDILQKEKQKYVTTIEAIPVNTYIQKIQSYGYDSVSFTDCIRVIDQIIAQWKQIQVRLDALKNDLQNIHQQHDQLVKRKKDLEANIVDMQQQYDEQTQFSCDKINGPCPYVEAIKWSSVKALAQQKDRMKKELTELNEASLWEKKSLLVKDIELISKDREKYIKQLQEIDWKACQEHFSQWQILQDKVKDVDKKIHVITQQLLQEQAQAKKQQELVTQKKILEEQLAKKILLLKQAQTSYEKDFQEIKSFDIRIAKELSDCVSRVTSDVHELKKHLGVFSDRQVQLNKLKEDQTRLKHLYNLFSKELMLLALKDFLPHIQQIMNVYLEDVADYTVSFLIEENVWDKIALDIFVQDYRGTRPVKSLSWGQKSLLKLAWILSIASMMKLTFLFLDETITSLDSLTTADVADVLHRFVQDNDMKFYVVTHALQIQEIPIRDSELQIP